MVNVKLQVGDIVRLKSTGPRMTVVRTGAPTGTIGCKGFDGNKLQGGDSEPEALMKPEEDVIPIA
jgi:uncharacterized protein YodC (DUF2158 family)